MSSTLDHERAGPVAAATAPGHAAPPAPLGDTFLGTYTLTDKLGDRWKLNAAHVACVVVGCLFFMHLNYLPLFHSDIWGHVAYGNWILDHRQLPAEDPFVPLADGVPIVDTAWLGQVAFAAAGRFGGGDDEWYGHLFAVTVLLTYLVLLRMFYLQNRHLGVAAASTGLVFLFAFSRHAIIRPEVFGSLCFALLIWLVIRTDERRARQPAEFAEPVAVQPVPWTTWLAVPLLFALWANLHGSFAVGFALLGCYAAGRAVEVAWHTGSLAAVFNDRLFRRWLIWTELAVVGTLCNPYGLDLILNTLMFGTHPNLKDVMEWYPLKAVSLEGIPMGLSLVVILALLRHSRSRLAVSDVLLLALFSLAVCLRVRMISWYAPVVMLVLAPHLADVVRQVIAAAGPAWKSICQPHLPRSPQYTLMALLLVWIAFAFSPISRPVLGGKPRPANRIYSRETPLGAVAWLREHPPQGLVCTPQWWGDWFAWRGGPQVQVLMTTNAVHVVPPRVWKDYMAIANATSGFERRLDRYRVNTLVVNKTLQKQLTQAVERLPGWTVVYEDHISLIATRTAPPTGESAPAAAEG